MNHQWPPQVSRALHQFSEAAPDAPSLNSVLAQKARREVVVSESSPFSRRTNRRRLVIACAAIVVVIGIVGVAISRSADNADDPAPAVTVGPNPTVAPSPATVAPSPTTVAPSPTTVAPSPPTVVGSPRAAVNGWVAFTAQHVVYVVRDGEVPRSITLPGSDRVSGTCPAFSPDGARLMFVREPGMVNPAVEHAELVVVTVGDDGTAAPLTTIPLPTSDACALWAPDGRWAAYAAEDSVWVVDTTTGEVRELPDHPGVTDLEWRPGTDELAFTGGCCNLGGMFHVGGFNGPIYIYSVNTGEIRTIPDVEAHHITWSPDGATLAYTESGAPRSERSGENGIWLVDADGTNVRQLTTASPYPNHHLGVVWSPRGDVIAYTRYCDGGCGFEVVLVATTGADPAHPQGSQWVIPPPVTGTSDNTVTWSLPDMITWSPEGTELLYTTARRGDAAGAGGPTIADGGIIAVPIDADQPARLLTADIIDPDLPGWRLSQQWGVEPVER